MPNNNSSNTNSYMTGSGSVRIRTPHPSDVLLGRGGGINSHVGNKVFRDWVHERKEDYNLAGSKAEKTRVAKEVMALVTDKGGRFLQKDPSSSMSSGWWVEVDELRALAKTSQALREGAPQIRAAHQDEKPATRKRKSSRGPKGGGGGSSRTGSSKASTTTSPSSGWPQTVPPAPPSDNNNENMPHHREVPSGTQEALNELGRNLLEAKSLAAKSLDKPHQTATLPSYSRPLMSNKEFQQQQQLQQQVDEEPSSNKKPRVESNNGSSMYVYTETPPLTSTISPPMVVPPPIPAPAARGANNNFMHRTHSLALSDISGGWVPDSSSAAEDLAEDFVNPFLDESDLVLLHPSWPSTSSRTPEPSPRPTPPATIIAPTQPQQQQQQEPAYQSPARTQLNSNDNSTRVGGMVRNVSSASDAGREEYRQLGELYGLPPSGSWSSSMNNIPTIQLMSNDHHHRSLSTSSSGNNDSNSNNNNDTYSPRGNNSNNNNDNNNSHGIRDFNEELRSIMDAVHPEDDITTPPLNGKEPPNGINIGMPTLLLPWRGGALQRRYGSSGALKKTSSSSGSNSAERQ